MENIKTGDIIFFRSKFYWYSPMSWLSAAIRLFAKIKYNHVGIIIEIDKCLFVLEAIGRGIIPTPLEYRYDKSDCIIVRPKKVSKTFRKDALSYVGYTKYDLMGLLVHQAVWTASGYRIWIGKKGPKEAKKTLYCYEYSSLMEGDKDWWMVKPKEYLERNRKKIR